MTENQKKTTIVGAALAIMLGAAMLLTGPTKLPHFAYEGETVAGIDIPPRMYVTVEPNARFNGRDVLPPPCNPGWTNFPCYVETQYEGAMVRLWVFRCLDWKDPSVVEKTTWDQKSCEIQKGFNAKLNFQLQ